MGVRWRLLEMLLLLVFHFGQEETWVFQILLILSIWKSKHLLMVWMLILILNAKLWMLVKAVSVS